jgi:uncharacterized membrane protein
VITIINLALLGEVVLIPLATRMLTGALYTAEALGFYLGLFALIGVTNAVSWSYAAFLTDIVRAPQRGPAVKLCVAFLLAVVPVSMTATGVLSALPGHLWTLALMPVVAFSATALRRAAAAIDGRRQRAPLPAPRMPGQVQAGQADAGPG